MITFETNAFTYRPATRTFVAEASSLSVPVGKLQGKFRIVNPKTGNGRDFRFSHADADGEDTYGWRYESPDGLNTLIIND